MVNFMVEEKWVFRGLSVNIGMKKGFKGDKLIIVGGRITVLAIVCKVNYIYV